MTQGSKQFLVPSEIRTKVEEIMSGSRSRFGHGLFFMEDEPEDGGTGGDDGGGSLLDDEAENGGDGGDDGSGDGDGGDGLDVDQIVDRVTKALESRFDSIADRRVNAIVKEVRKQADAAKKDDEDGGKQAPSEPSVNAGDAREARLVYREYVAHKVTFLGDEERTHAMDLAQAKIGAYIGSGMDPEEAGRKAAEDTAAAVSNLRKFYEKKTLAALRRKGLIAEDGRGDGQAPKNGGKPGDQSGFKAGAAKVADLFGDRIVKAE